VQFVKQHLLRFEVLSVTEDCCSVLGCYAMFTSKVLCSIFCLTWHNARDSQSSKTCVFRLVLVCIAFENEIWVIMFSPKLRTRCRNVIISETFFVSTWCSPMSTRLGGTQRRRGHWELVNLLSPPRIEA